MTFCGSRARVESTCGFRSSKSFALRVCFMGIDRDSSSKSSNFPYLSRFMRRQLQFDHFRINFNPPRALFYVLQKFHQMAKRKEIYQKHRRLSQCLFNAINGRKTAREENFLKIFFAVFWPQKAFNLLDAKLEAVSASKQKWHKAQFIT